MLLGRIYSFTWGKPKASANKGHQGINFSKNEPKANTMGGGSAADESSNTKVKMQVTPGREIDGFANYDRVDTRENAAGESSNTTESQSHSKNIEVKLLKATPGEEIDGFANYDPVYTIDASESAIEIFKPLSSQAKSVLFKASSEGRSLNEEILLKLSKVDKVLKNIDEGNELYPVVMNKILADENTILTRSPKAIFMSNDGTLIRQGAEETEETFFGRVLKDKLLLDDKIVNSCLQAEKPVTAFENIIHVINMGLGYVSIATKGGGIGTYLIGSIAEMNKLKSLPAGQQKIIKEAHNPAFALKALMKLSKAKVDIQDIKKIVSHRDSLILQFSSNFYEYIDGKGKTRILKTEAELQEDVQPSQKPYLFIDLDKEDSTGYGEIYNVSMEAGKWKFSYTSLKENDTVKSFLRATPIEKDERGGNIYEYTLQNSERCSGKILSILSQLSKEHKQNIYANKVDILDFFKVYNRTHDVAKSVKISSILTRVGKEFDEKTLAKVLKVDEIWASNGNSEQDKRFWMMKKVLNDEPLMTFKQTENGKICIFMDADGTLVKQDDGETREAFVDRVKKQVLSGEESMLVKVYAREGQSPFKFLTNDDTSFRESMKDFASGLDSATKKVFYALLERPVHNDILKALMRAKDIPKTINALSKRFTNPNVPLNYLSIEQEDGSSKSVVVGSYDAMQQYMEACVAVGGDAHSGLTLYKKLTNSDKRVNKENISHLLQTDSSFSRELPDATQENLQLYLEGPKASDNKRPQVIDLSKHKRKANTMGGGSAAGESSNTTESQSHSENIELKLKTPAGEAIGGFANYDSVYTIENASEKAIEIFKPLSSQAKSVLFAASSKGSSLNEEILLQLSKVDKVLKETDEGIDRYRSVMNKILADKNIIIIDIPSKLVFLSKDGTLIRQDTGGDEKTFFDRVLKDKLLLDDNIVNSCLQAEKPVTAFKNIIHVINTRLGYVSITTKGGGIDTYLIGPIAEMDKLKGLPAEQQKIIKEAHNPAFAFKALMRLSAIGGRYSRYKEDCIAQR